MSDVDLDLDLLATHLKSRLEGEGLSARRAASEIGCSASTVSRILQGSEAPTTPDSINLMRAISWLGKSVSDFERRRRKKRRTTSVADVEVHLRALPGLSGADMDALVAMVKAAYDSARKSRSKTQKG